MLAGSASTGLPAAARMRRHPGIGVIPRPRLEAQDASFSPSSLSWILSVLALLLLVGLPRAAEIPGRVSPPPQLGFQPGAPDLPPFVADRVLLKLTQQARKNSKIPASWRYREEIAGRATGLAAVDRVLTDAGVRSMRRAMIEPANAADAERLGIGRWVMIELASPRAAEMVDRLSRLSDVESATLDYVAFPAVVPADPLYSMHWGHNNTAQMLSYNWANNNHETGSPVGTVGFDANAQAAWDGSQGFGSSSVIIGIIDTGVQAGHPDLTQVAGWDFGDNDSNPDDNSASAGHGTACAGIAASRANSLGSVGIAAGCSIMPLKVANSAGTMSFSSIQSALMWGADHGANILSMSLGAAINQRSRDRQRDPVRLQCRLHDPGRHREREQEHDQLSGDQRERDRRGRGARRAATASARAATAPRSIPASAPIPNGYTCDGERWWGSNYGVTTAGAAGAVDVIAPTILPTTDRLGSAGYDPSDYSKWFNGTSCATPYAAGVCALIKSKNPSWTPSQIRTQLLTTAQDVVSVESGAGWDRYAGYGMVDAAAAVGGAPPADQITVTSPNGGETLTAGSVATITWTWTGSFGTVNIDYSTNGGSTWTAIATGTANDGSQAWTVPSTATTQGRVRISGGTATDMSNANFTISTGGGGSYATLPYTTGFESGALDQYWSSAVTADGRVRVAHHQHAARRELPPLDGRRRERRLQPDRRAAASQPLRPDAGEPVVLVEGLRRRDPDAGRHLLLEQRRRQLREGVQPDAGQLLRQHLAQLHDRRRRARRGQRTHAHLDLHRRDSSSTTTIRSPPTASPSTTSR